MEDLFSGIKALLLFVVWQKNKAQVVTDYSASELNDRIPKIKAKICYNDMKTFSQAMYNVKHSFFNDMLVIWKSNIASAFLNLPAHSLWQIW